MSKADFLHSGEFVQLYCHGVQLRCGDLNELLQTSDIAIKRVLHNDCFDMYEMHRSSKPVSSPVNRWHLMLFQDKVPAIIERAFEDLLKKASDIGDALTKICDFMQFIDCPIQPVLQMNKDKAEISLKVRDNFTSPGAQAMQLLMVMRLMKIIRIISQLAAESVPVYAFRLMGACLDIAEPYIKFHRPEFIYHRQKHNAIVIPSHCLSIKCHAEPNAFSDFLRQHIDVFLPLPAGKKTTAENSEFAHELETWMQRQLGKKYRLPTDSRANESTHCSTEMFAAQAPNASVTPSQTEEQFNNEQAIQRLVKTTVPAVEIGRRLGTGNSSTLSRTFKETNKLRPGELHNGRIIRLN